MRDFSPELADLRRRLEDARGYLQIDAARARLADLEKEASEPSLWDDPDAARSYPLTETKTRRIARLFRDVRPLRIYDGPSEVHRWSIARRVSRAGGTS